MNLVLGTERLILRLLELSDAQAWLDYGFNQTNIEKMNAYTHAENGASNHVLQKVGFQFMENYPDKDGVIWKWWQLLNF